VIDTKKLVRGFCLFASIVLLWASSSFAKADAAKKSPLQQRRALANLYVEKSYLNVSTMLRRLVALTNSSMKFLAPFQGALTSLSILPRSNVRVNLMSFKLIGLFEFK
jgi:hypothetical protein